MKMKRKRLKNAMSITLAAAMLSTSMVGNVANATVIIPDTDVGTGSGTITTENSVTVDATTSDDGIVTTDDGIEISTVKENLTSAVQAVDDGITVEDEDGLKAGSKVKLSVSAGNKSEKAAKFKLYFWNYADKLPEDKSTWKDVLKDVPEKLTAEVGTATITDSDGTEVEAKATFMQDKDGDTSTASYVEVELPANTTLSLDVSVANEAAGKVVAVPYLESDSEMSYGDAIGIDWEEDGITVDDSVIIEDTTSSDEEDEDGIKVDSETEDTDDVTVSVDDEAENDSIEVEADTEETEDAVTVDDDTVDADLFASQRLVILTDDASVIRTDDTVLGQYDNIYLLEYDSIDETMDAYSYYKDLVTAVEPDTAMDAAEEDGIEVDSDVATMTAEDNPIAVLSDTEDSEPVQTASNVIALIDTGVSESKNVIDRVSLIDDALEGNGHGNDMLQAIVDQNENANVLSVRVMGDDGRGTVSAIIAGMEYALNQNVNIINLSLASKTNLANSVLKAEIEKAVDAGITVVGAAGNDNADVKDYMPGSVEAAYIIGAAGENGERLEGSNYGDTVDYNVVAGSTSVAAAKFSGFLSTGMDVMSVVNVGGLIYQTNYLETDTDNSVEPTVPADEDDDLPDDEDDDPEEWQIGDYPAAGTSSYVTEHIWEKDTTYDFVNYNPYGEDVTVTCTTPDVAVDFAVGNTVEFAYNCVLNSNTDYTWKMYCDFTFVDKRDVATDKSEDSEKIFPEIVSQERNEGYNGIVPKKVGDIVEGREFTVLMNAENFELDGLVQDYNPNTFKVNHVYDDGFDISTPGTYKVKYEMSYFMYYEYTWFVEDTIHVVDPDTLEPGIYLTSTESTLMFKGADGVNRGYSEIVNVTDSDNVYTLSCIDEGYEVDMKASDESVNTADIYEVVDTDNNQKQMTIHVFDTEKPVFLSIFRPDYESQKMFSGGGWQVPSIPEEQVAEIKDFDAYEEDVLNQKEDENDEYMEVADGWVTKASTTITSRGQTGGQTGHNYPSGNACTNWGTVYLSEKKANVSSWAKGVGYAIDESKIPDIGIACISGHSYWGLPCWRWITCSVNMYIQEWGSSARLLVTCTYYYGDGYQVFYGADSAGTTAKATLKLRKRMLDVELAEFTDRIDDLYTTFTIYTDKNGTKKYKTMKIDGRETEPGDTYVSFTAQTTVDPDTYWVRETYTIEGTEYNKELYGPIKVKAGDSVDIGREFIGNSKYSHLGKTGWIYNRPFYFNYKKTLMVKNDDTGQPVKGAVIRVQYSDYGGSKWKTRRTWYFKTDEKGEVHFGNDWYLKSWKDSKGEVHASGALLHRSNGECALPVGFLRIKEVDPPKGYQICKDTYEIELKEDSKEARTISTIVDKKKQTLEVIDPLDGSFKLGKFLYDYDNFAGKTPRDYIKTEFTIYKKFNASEPDNLKALSDVVQTIKVEDTAKNLKSKTLTVTGLQPGTYYLFETGRCPGAAQNLNIYSFVITEGQTEPTTTITNVRTNNTGTKVGNRPFRFTGKILSKVDKQGNALKVKDAIFKIVYSPYRQSESGYQEMYTWFLKTDENGEVFYDKAHWVDSWNGMKSDAPLTLDDGNYAIPSGTLYVTEVNPPEGFDIDGETHELLLNGEKDENGYYSIPELTATPLKIVEPDDVGDKWKVRVNLKKVDENGKGLAGAIFGVWDTESCEGTPIVKLTSGDDGTTNTALISRIKWENKTYQLWCKEIQPPSGYTQIKDKFDLTFDRSVYETEIAKNPDYEGELKSFGPASGIPNKEGWTVRVQANKVNQTLDGLEGAEFTVYSDASCSNESVVGKIKSGSDGLTDILSVGVDSDVKTIKLYAKETAAPPNCTPVDDRFEVEFNKDDYDALKEAGDKSGELKFFGPESGIINEETPGTPTPTPPVETPTPTPSIDGPGVHVVKHSTAPDDMMDLNSYSLEGATFSVTSSDGFSGTLTTDASGISNTLTLPDNSDKQWVPPVTDKAGNVTTPGYYEIIPKTTIYTIKETTPPKNHKITEKSPKYISVTMPYQKDTVFTVEFNDDIITCKPLELEKLGVKGNPIEGVIYKVEYFDGPDDGDDPVKTWYLVTDKNGKIYMDSSHVSTLPQYHSDTFFTYKGNVVLPVDGYLKATEVQAPAEYVVDDTPVTFTTSENQDMSTMVYNDMERCKVNLRKYDNDGKAIAGVEFELKFVKAAIPLTDRKNPYFSRLLKEGETITRSTDWEGNCNFADLDQGDYEITEIKTAMGQTLLKDPIKFTLPFRMTQEEARDYGENLDMSKAKEDKDYTNKWFFFECTYEITNTPTFHLPETGATGTWNYGFMGLGVALVVGGCSVGTMLFGKRRRRKKQNK